jgi:GNAT superfamily N-acetyltransferase
MTTGDRMRRIERILRIAPRIARLLAPPREKNFGCWLAVDTAWDPDAIEQACARLVQSSLATTSWRDAWARRQPTSGSRPSVGAAILRHIIAAAQARGMSRLSLETGSWPYFAPARALYARHGFVECPPFGDYRPDPNSVFMTLVLPSS